MEVWRRFTLCVYQLVFLFPGELLIVSLPPTRTTTVCIYFHHVQTTTVLYTSCRWWWTVSISPQNISQVKHVSKHSLFQNDCILTFVVSVLQTIIFPTSFWEPFSNWNVQVLTDGLRKRAVLHFRVTNGEPELTPLHPLHDPGQWSSVMLVTCSLFCAPPSGNNLVFKGEWRSRSSPLQRTEQSWPC